MDNNEETGPQGPYSHRRYGQYRSNSTEQSNLHFPGYTWTQFSGMPTQPAAESQEPFMWDRFVTPPTSPLSNEFDLNTANYYPNIPLMHSLGAGAMPEYDTGLQDADSASLASTPVAQSLLEALNSANPLLNPLSEDNLTSVNFHDITCQEGYELYAEALKTLSSQGFGSFEGFESSDALSSSPTPSTPNTEADSPSANTSKPSYSEVAKTMKCNTSSGKDEIDLGKKRTSDSTQSKSFKANKKFVPRPVRARNSSMPDDMRPTVSPNSKYGLDDFGDLSGMKNSEKGNSSSGLENISVISRKNSTSSVSSGTSGIEEIHLTKSSNTYSNTSEGTPNIDKIASNKEKVFEENIHQKKNDKQFFDDRRLFQSKDTNKKRGQSKLVDDEDCKPTILNNGKPSYSAWCSSDAPKKSTHYINNNLRDSQKKTNQNLLFSSSKDVHSDQPYSGNSSGRTDKSRSRSASTKAETSPKPSMPLQTSFDQELIDEWLTFLYDKGKLCLQQLWTLVLMVILLIFSIVVYLVSGCVHLLSWAGGRAWYLLETKVLKRKLFGGQSWKKGVADIPKKIGLDENISLPATGDEAMQRLLACKGKDPYSILGLKSSASDDDIKKYYRKQAVLVHPDKNQQPGAEEAFKILGHAFDLIGDVSKRQAYDRQLQEATEAEAAMREFNDLLTKLQEKIQQASNMMRCDNCGGKHKRIPIDRPWYSARFCDRCSSRHSAKEGDVWAETSMLGFLWHYYACMEGKVFDITEWVACKKDFFKHMQANAHHVFYRIASEGNRGHHGKLNGRNTADGGSSEADLEDFISHLFHQAMQSDNNNTSQPSWQPGSQASGQSWSAPQGANTGAAAAGAATGKRGGKRRKKKH